ncbi:rhodanese-like domain-containing protein [Pleurocapsales cyanobacterium LEGE 10410]|nr:rhodanese-like domain-containing protein [Pleurocapsales cyanobacterium LEGE 10410]
MSEPEQKAEAEVISDIKEKVTEPIPTPPDATPKSSAQAMKERLQWGEPGLTIIDARDRESFLEERITGAMLFSDMNKLEKNREIYVYSNTDEEAAKTADELRQDGYESVSQLQGGLAGWKAVQGPTEGRAS